MKKLIGVIVFMFLFSSTVFAASAIEKSKIFMKVGDFQQAKIVLYREYKNNPSAKILHLLGTAYLMSGDYTSATNYYDKCIRLDSDYKNEIAQTLADQGSLLVARHDFDNAKICYLKASQYCPDYRETVPAALIKKGKKVLYNEGIVTTSFLYFSLAKDINPRFNNNIATYLWNASKILSFDDEPSLKTKALFYTYIIVFSNKYNNEIGLSFAKMAKLNNVSKGLKASFKKSAKNFLDKDAFEKEFPPPTWKQEGKRYVFSGKGMGDNDYLRTIKCGTNFRIGDKIIITGQNAEVAMYSKWNKLVNGEYSVTIKHAKKGDGIGVRAPKGEKFFMNVYRFK